jgi:hypothetical protein
VMVGDTPYDIEAAARAKVPSIALRCGGWWGDAALSGATAIYDDPAELVVRFEESPIGMAVSGCGGEWVSGCVGAASSPPFRHHR